MTTRNKKLLGGGHRPLLLVTRSYQVEAIAIRLEAIRLEDITTSKKKLLGGGHRY